MRDQLKNLTSDKYWVRGISESDFYHSVGLVKDMVLAGRAECEREIAFLRSKNPDVSNSTIDEITRRNDECYSYLWQFTLIRLQGQFEAILVEKFLANSGSNYRGFGQIMQAMRGLGASISKAEENELRMWAKLRNCFTHAPPEAYRAVPLMDTDIEEYATLLIRLYRRWSHELGHASDA